LKSLNFCTTLASILSLLVPNSGRADAAERPRCNFAVFSPSERARHRELSQRLKTALDQAVELPNGYGLRFEPPQFTELAEWITLESKCCPFLNFQLELGPQPGGDLWLRLTGNAEVKEFISIDLELLLHPRVSDHR